MKNKKIIIAILIMIVLTGFDQITKVWAENFLAGKGSVNVLGEYAVLVLAKNRGGFLSVGNQANDVLWLIVFIVIPLIVLFALTFYVLTYKSTNNFCLTAWVLIFSGGLGNIIDRILYGSVTDFMNIGIGNIRTGIFNVADLYIVFFAVYVAIRYLIALKRKEVLI